MPCPSCHRGNPYLVPNCCQRLRTGCEVALILGPVSVAREEAFMGDGSANSGQSPVVGELDGEVVVLGLDQGLDGLKIVPALAADSKLVTLDLRLDALGTLIANQLGHLLGVLSADAFLGRRRDLVQLAGRARLASVERLEADATFDQLGLEDVEHRLHSLLRVGLHLDLLAGPLDACVGVLEVEALTHFLGRLVQGVVHLLPVDFADHIERVLRCHDHHSVLTIGVLSFCRSGIGWQVAAVARPIGTGWGSCYCLSPPAVWISWPGRLPEWPKGAVCKTVGIAYVGSNPTPATRSELRPDKAKYSALLRFDRHLTVAGPSGIERAAGSVPPSRASSGRRS